MIFMKKMLLGILLVASIAIVLFYIILFPPFPLVPEIGRDLKSSLGAPGNEFENRVKERFRDPVLESLLVKDLIDQGFKVFDSQAFFEKTRFPCRLVWRTFWSESAGYATSINAVHSKVCL